MDRFDNLCADEKPLLYGENGHPILFETHCYQPETNSFYGINPIQRQNLIQPHFVQPFEIITSDDEDITTRGTGQNISLSEQIQREVSYSQRDGERIVADESQAAMRSQLSGQSVSKAIDKRISKTVTSDEMYSNFDGHEIISNHDAIEARNNSSGSAFDSAQQPRLGDEGFKIIEYKSIYDTSTGASTYTIPEYKSIYDR